MSPDAKMRVLIVRVGALGDVLHALPAVAALRKARPDWVIDWVVDERWAPVLVNSEMRGPVVRSAIHVPIKAWKQSPLAWSTARSMLGFRKLRGRYDVVVDMQGTVRSAVIGRLAGGASLAGYADPRESMAALLYARKIERRGVHVVEQGAALLSEATGVELAPADVELPREEWAENWAGEEFAGKRLCVLTPGGGWGAKQWPAEKYGALAGQLRGMGFEVRVNAPRKDDVVARTVVAASAGAAEMVVCNVAGMVALMRRASVVVGGDSGPVHMAAALGVPVVALFGPTSPERNGPWGPGKMAVLRHPDSVTTYKRTEATEVGLGRIPVEDVREAAARLSNGEFSTSPEL